MKRFSKVLMMMLAIMLVGSIGGDRAKLITPIHAEGTFTEDDFWNVYNAVLDAKLSLTQEDVDIARGLVDAMPDNVMFLDLTKVNFGNMLDFYQREIDERDDVEPDPDLGPIIPEFFSLENGGGQYNGEGYSIKTFNDDLLEGDKFQYRYLRFGTTWTEWSDDNPAFTDIKAEQDKYTVEVRLVNEDEEIIETGRGYVTITPRPVTITVHNKEKDFGEEDPEITYTVEGVLEDSPLVLIRTHRYSQVVNDELTEADEQVGFYQARLVATFVHNPNYDVMVELGDFTIHAKVGEDLQVLGKETVYDGQKHTITVENLIEGDNIEYSIDDGVTWVTEKSTFTNAGEYNVKVKVTNPTYEDRVGDATVTITKKDVTIKVNDAKKIYGESDPTFDGTVDGLVKDTDLLVSYVRDGTDEAIGLYKEVLTADFTDNPNYNVNVEKGDFEILEDDHAELGAVVPEEKDEVKGAVVTEADVPKTGISNTEFIYLITLLTSFCVLFITTRKRKKHL